MLFLDDDALLDLASPGELVGPMREAFERYVSPPPRNHYALSYHGYEQSLMLMPAWNEQDAIGVKVITVMPANPKRGLASINGVYVMFDRPTGLPSAILSARGLTAMRTAAVSALASSFLSRISASTLLIIGTGALAPFLVRAHAAVRPIERVCIWGRDAAKADELAERLADLCCEVAISPDLAAVTAEADVISCATSSCEPLLHGGLVRPGTHVDLVGSYAPHMREADTELMRRGRLIVDTPTAFSESGDLIVAVEEGAIDRTCATLADLSCGKADGRLNEDEITIFKSVGTAVADLAAAQEILRRDKTKAI